MKNKFLIFLKKYWFCFYLSLLMVVGLFLTTIFADLYASGGYYIQFDLKEMYLLFGLPLYGLIYGYLSYKKTKNIWFPQLCLLAVNFLYWFRFDIDALAWAGTYIWTFVPVIFSLIGTGMTALVYTIIKSIKENKN